MLGTNRREKLTESILPLQAQTENVCVEKFGVELHPSPASRPQAWQSTCRQFSPTHPTGQLPPHWTMKLLLQPLGQCSGFQVPSWVTTSAFDGPDFPPAQSLLPPTRQCSVSRAPPAPSSETFCSKDFFFKLAIKTRNYFFLI